MKKRLLALLLALVMALGMLPTAFALDADEPAGAISAGAADAEPPAEGETEEEAAEPEQPEAEEPAEEPEEPEQAGEEPAAEPEEAEKPAAKEAEVAAFAADTDATEAYLLGKRLRKGYYTTESTESTTLNMETCYAEKDISWKNYIYYENGELTVTGTVEVGNDESYIWAAVLSVFSGKLTVKGNGSLKLSGYEKPAVLLNTGAEIDFNLTPARYGVQLTLESTDAVAVEGNLTITNAGVVHIESKPATDGENITAYNTIKGNARLHAKNITVKNTLGSACVNGNLSAVADILKIINKSADMATLTGNTRAYNLTTDLLFLQNYCGAAVDGDIKIEAIGKETSILHKIIGCTTNSIPVVNGNIEASGGELTLSNQNSGAAEFKDYKADGLVLKGNLTLKNASGLGVYRPKGEGTDTLIEGNIELIDCSHEN